GVKWKVFEKKGSYVNFCLMPLCAAIQKCLYPDITPCFHPLVRLSHICAGRSKLFHRKVMNVSELFGSKRTRTNSKKRFLTLTNMHGEVWRNKVRGAPHIFVNTLPRLK